MDAVSTGTIPRSGNVDIIEAHVVAAMEVNMEGFTI